MNKIRLYGQLNGDKVIVTDKKVIDSIRNRSFGEFYPDYAVLDFYEAMYLIENSNMGIFYRNVELRKEDFVQRVLQNTDIDFIMHKYQVFKELRNKGHVVKTGLKFGFDFRVYPKDKTIEEAHTEFVVEVCAQDKVIDTQIIARSVRMALGLHTKFVLAMVDNELEVTFYTIDRTKM